MSTSMLGFLDVAELLKLCIADISRMSQSERVGCILRTSPNERFFRYSSTEDVLENCIDHHKARKVAEIYHAQLWVTYGNARDEIRQKCGMRKGFDDLVEQRGSCNMLIEDPWRLTIIPWSKSMSRYDFYSHFSWTVGEKRNILGTIACQTCLLDSGKPGSKSHLSLPMPFWVDLTRAQSSWISWIHFCIISWCFGRPN